MRVGGSRGNRTRNPPVKSRMLCLVELATRSKGSSGGNHEWSASPIESIQVIVRIHASVLLFIWMRHTPCAR
jgi:hypothetical protein